MKPLGDTNSHFWLVQRMAQATETDLVAAMARADLSNADWAEMVQSCRGCDWTEGCKRWLAAEETTQDGAAPGACINRERFLRLKEALEEVEP
ncbi:DUF6455 family protein [Shimia sp. FJ5]|uniref:DUF6455 family protein n=1 Tax=Shimia sp. FJ5 TaxID=3079054 RepID=UPI002622654E|nr:DUF6455 family protein [Shimia sp. FJ5]MDV4145216.1 DUF6455 family protein [Shimia sp. FJ5]